MKSNDLSYKVFKGFNYVFMVFLVVITLIPFINMLAKSLSSEAFLMSKQVFFWPKGINLESYKLVMKNVFFRKSMVNSFFLISFGTLTNMVMTILAAYPLSRRRGFPGQKLFMFLFLLTMFFNGGIIPTYIIVRDTGLINSLWSLILPVAVSPFNLIILRNFFLSIPESLEEAAEIDGAGKWRTMIQIVLPLSKPVLATLTLFYTVSHWNGYFYAVMYINDKSHYPLQLYIREIIQSIESALDGLEAADVPTAGVKAATMFISMIPILIVYPFIQRYFVKGIMVGSVKG